MTGEAIKKINYCLERGISFTQETTLSWVRTEFFDNDNGFIEVAEYVNGELILKGEPQKEWVKELLGRL